jgi:hypothetical protein
VAGRAAELKLVAALVDRIGLAELEANDDERDADCSHVFA